MKNTLIDFTEINSPLSDSFRPPIEPEDRLPHAITFYRNPFYDKVFMLLLDMRIRTYQSKTKAHLVNYKEIVRQMVEAVQLDDRFPYAGDMLLNLHFTGPAEQLMQLDVDNMAKLLIDQMKKIVMVDDNRVPMLWVEKSMHVTTGCKVGITFLKSGIPMLMPPLHLSEDEMEGLLSAHGMSLEDLTKSNQASEPRCE